MVKVPHWPPFFGNRPGDLDPREFKLERMHKLLGALGNPEKKLPPVVHVAGTNGKGSVIAYLRAILVAAGYKVHVYTSPHLVHFNERIVVAGEEIKDEPLYGFLEECRIASEKNGIPVTFFEGTTAAAFLAFSKIKADIVLLEVGLGGRLDATNVLEKPALTVITPVSLDHMQFLGNTVEKIAAEKAAIIKQGVACVVGPQEKAAEKVIEISAVEKNAPLYRFGREWSAEKRNEHLHYGYGQIAMAVPMPHLLGEHQIANAGTAITCALALEGKFVISKEAIDKGISNARWPARMQRLLKGHLQPFLYSGAELWLDGGHNEAAGRVLASHAKKAWADMPLYLICGMMDDKETSDFLKPFKGVAEKLFAVPVPGAPACKAPVEIKADAKAVGIKAEVAANVEEAVRRITEESKEVYRILICGSLYLAGSVLADNG